jgi:transcriptional regulator with XRE-family HTH domain
MTGEKDQVLTLMDIRLRAQMTQREFAELLGVTVSTVSNWERGVQVPRLTFFQTKLMMDASGCSIDDLIGAFQGTQDEREKTFGRRESRPISRRGGDSE